MKRSYITQPLRAGMLAILGFALLGSAGYAQSVKAKGLIEGRSGANIILKTSDSERVIVLLTDNTKVGQVQGVLKARRKDMSMAALIPGLAIEVEGMYNAERQLVASMVKFKGDDLKQAQSVQAGLRETKAQTQQNKEELERHNAELQAQNAALQQHQKELTAQQQSIAANQDKIAANKAAIDVAIARFGQLDDYYILDEVTVYFGNGKTALDPKYRPQLQGFAERAKKVDAYMVQVVGYASATGSEEVNQRLSEDRAHAVTNFLLQQCKVPMMNVMAPGAMGESEQVASNKTADGEAENRRVVVRVLQNKGVAGLRETASQR
jgi:outer membrane protein OmpA-like peptidoglycan-associated protein